MQLRDKHLDDAALVERARLARRVCTATGCRSSSTTVPDLAASSGADGVHVGQDDMSAVSTRLVVGTDALVGLSSHAAPELDTAIGGPDAPPAPVDYLSAGPVVATPTKPGRPGTGLGYVREAVARSPWPVWITGGVAPDTVADMVGSGCPPLRGRPVADRGRTTRRPPPALCGGPSTRALNGAALEADRSQGGLAGRPR